MFHEEMLSSNKRGKRIIERFHVTAATLVFQINPLGVELFSYVNAFFCSNKFA